MSVPLVNAHYPHRCSVATVGLMLALPLVSAHCSHLPAPPALLTNSQSSHSTQGTRVATRKQDKCQGWISKQRRFRHRRSTDRDVCRVVAEAQDSKENMRHSILALYALHGSSNTSVAKDVMHLRGEEALALDGQRSKSPERHAQDMPLVDLTMSPSTPVLGHHGSGTSCSTPKQSHDELFWKGAARLVGRECRSF